tara:strand:- start:132 stop:362 length:231 start_codon:yes stop_codon:yes gene_type:complete
LPPKHTLLNTQKNKKNPKKFFFHFKETSVSFNLYIKKNFFFSFLHRYACPLAVYWKAIFIGKQYLLESNILLKAMV